MLNLLILFGALLASMTVQAASQKARNPFSFGYTLPDELLVTAILHDLDLEVCAYSNDENTVEIKSSKIKSPST